MTSQIIGTLSEKSLHKSLKVHYSIPSDQIENKLDGYVIDITRGNLLIEIQSGNFSKIKTKLSKLLEKYDVLLVYPIPKIKWIVRVDQEAKVISRRKSPKRGIVPELFRQLIYIPTIMKNSNFTLDIPLVEIEEIWKDDGKGSWRRKGWSKFDQVLLNISEKYKFSSPKDLSALIPTQLEAEFTNRDLAESLNTSYRTAQSMTYCLRHLGEIEISEKRGNSLLYQRTRKRRLERT